MFSTKPIPGAQALLEAMRPRSLLEWILGAGMVAVVSISLILWLRQQTLEQRTEQVYVVLNGVELLQGLFALEHARYAATLGELGLDSIVDGVHVQMTSSERGFSVVGRLPRSGLECNLHHQAERATTFDCLPQATRVPLSPIPARY